MVEIYCIQGFFTTWFCPLSLVMGLPCLEFPQSKSCIKRDNLRHLNWPSLEFACWQSGRKGQTLNGGKYFPAYSNFSRYCIHYRVLYILVDHFKVNLKWHLFKLKLFLSPVRTRIIEIMLLGDTFYDWEFLDPKVGHLTSFWILQDLIYVLDA